MTFQPVFDKIERPVLIAGPCSAETEAQVMETAHGLAAQGIDLYRAGIWKPRTKPGGFEGVGTEGLAWLQRVKQEVGLKTTTEVANTQHVFEALKYGIDVLWIGARTTVNPFSVQEVADALAGVDIPILIKNPVNADLKLWMGAIERIYKAGIKRIAAVHRGFSVHGETKFRNAPLWQLPIELKRQFPDLQIICDHSHICGRRDILAPIAQQALDLGYDGLMTEVHPRPDEAWSDAEQQITPFTYGEMVRNLTARKLTTTNADFLKSLDYLRHQIDELDDRLMQLLGSRMKLADQIGEYKKQNNISIYQPSRWNEILEQAMEKGAALGLSGEFVEAVLKAIHEESIGHQSKVMNEKAAVE
ncbi:MAG: bifunctional 3-deoxy-7-phosphoheptulonate synthase/chorismate mutase type II [Saprospiraceae bacterium]|nr:bifunctional 3-deoxy-7-phosphoheptulonate synthase/chorismate mutase type II [Saprospiraceae bacterium]